MENFKHWILSEAGKDVFVILIVILVGLGSFELGRLSKSTNSTSGLKIEYPGDSSVEASAASAFDASNLSQNFTKSESKPKAPLTTIYFASKRGHKYYPMTCSAGKSIVMENRIYFDTAAQAQAAGYELSASCQ